MQPTSPVHIGDYTFGDREFAAIARITRDRAGISLKESKRTMVYARLSKRLRKQGFPSFSDYLTFLESPGNDDEIDALIAVLTTNVTSFFREPHHFEAFAAQVLPVAIERAKKGDRVRFWSSACSTGEEPYSLALTILANFPEAGKFDLKILASDVNERVVGIGARATYATEVSRQIPDSYHALLGPDCLRGDTFCMPEKVRDLVTFRRLNLFDPWPFAGQFDAIFCRNVAIYFDKPTQETLWSNLAERLTPRGHLFIGHSERISGPAQNILSQCGVTQYARSATKPITASGGLRAARKEADMSLKDMLKVTVVDDMSTSRALITQALDWMGVGNYNTQNDGAEALNFLTKQPSHLVISDYNMPGMDGLTLLQGLRQHAVTQGIGFILVTGRADQTIIQRGQQFGMNNFIQKPFDPQAMKACIEQVVGRL